MKRILALLLALLTLCSLTPSALAATPETVEPLYENASKANVTLSISSGTATIKVTCDGSAALSSAQITTYIERRSGASWVRVENGYTGNEWTYSTKQYQQDLHHHPARLRRLPRRHHL